MQITPNIHMVEGIHSPTAGWKFLAKSPPRTVTKFHHDRYSLYYPTLISDGKNLTLFDTGTPDSYPELQACIQGMGHSVKDIRHIFISHCHVDHLGEVHRLVQESGAKVYAHELEVPYLERKVLYENRAYDPIRVDEPVKDGDVLDVLGGLQVVHIPGHTPGHIALYLPKQRVMLGADLIRHSRGCWHLCPPQYSVDSAAIARSMVKVGKLDFDIMVLYHGEPVLSNAAAQYRENIEYMQAISDIFLPEVKEAFAPEVVIENADRVPAGL